MKSNHARNLGKEVCYGAKYKNCIGETNYPASTTATDFTPGFDIQIYFVQFLIS